MNDPELKEVIKAVRRRLATIRSAAEEIDAMLSTLVGESKGIKEKDENGEPTWKYAVRVLLPKDIYLTKKFLMYGEEHGFNKEQMQVIMFGPPAGSPSAYEGFIKYYERNAGNKNGKWSNWSLVFMKWVREQRDRKTKQENGSFRGSSRFERAAVRS